MRQVTEQEWKDFLDLRAAVTAPYQGMSLDVGVMVLAYGKECADNEHILLAGLEEQRKLADKYYENRKALIKTAGDLYRIRTGTEKTPYRVYMNGSNKTFFERQKDGSFLCTHGGWWGYHREPARLAFFEKENREEERCAEYHSYKDLTETEYRNMMIPDH